MNTYTMDVNDSFGMNERIKAGELRHSNDASDD